MADLSVPAVRHSFLAAGYASAVSWSTADHRGVGRASWPAARLAGCSDRRRVVRRAGVRHRHGVGRLPVASRPWEYGGLVGGYCTLVPRGVSGGVVSLTPIAIAAQLNARLGFCARRRRGVIGCRGGRRCLAGWPCPLPRWLNLYALLWAVRYHSERLAQWVISGAQIRAAGCRLGVALSLLTGGALPVSMIGFSGESCRTQRSRPRSRCWLYAVRACPTGDSLAPRCSIARCAPVLVHRVLARQPPMLMALRTSLAHDPVVIGRLSATPGRTVPQPSRERPSGARTLEMGGRLAW